MKPEKGFYYHCKHDPSGPFNNAAYELLGTAFNTESAASHSDDPNDFVKDEVVVYRPIFSDSLIEKAGRDFWVRPVAMFEEIIKKDGKIFPRFQKITDPKIIEELVKIRDRMYK